LAGIQYRARGLEILLVGIVLGAQAVRTDWYEIFRGAEEQRVRTCASTFFDHVLERSVGSEQEYESIVAEGFPFSAGSAFGKGVVAMDRTRDVGTAIKFLPCGITFADLRNADGQFYQAKKRVLLEPPNNKNL